MQKEELLQAMVENTRGGGIVSDVEWCQNCGDVVTDDGCACAAIPKPTGVLTRLVIRRDIGHGFIEDPNGQFVRYTEAQHVITQQAQELEGIDDILARRPALADCVTRRDKIETAINVAKQVDDLKQQLAASQARCREMEEKDKLFACESCYQKAWITCSREDAGAIESYSGGMQTWWKCEHCWLKATLAAREAVIGQQEATIRGYRHSVKIIGQQHDDRKAERDAAVQEAGRLKEACAKIAERNAYMNPDAEPGGNHGGPGSCEYGCGSVIAKAIRGLK